MIKYSLYFPCFLCAQFPQIICIVILRCVIGVHNNMAISSCSSTNESINVLVSQGIHIYNYSTFTAECCLLLSTLIMGLCALGCDKHRVSICIDNTVGHLKEQLYEVTGIPIEGQKLIFKGVYDVPAVYYTWMGIKVYTCSVLIFCQVEIYKMTKRQFPALA